MMIGCGLDRRFHRPAIADGDDIAGALILEDALHALDGKTLIIEQVPDAFQQQHIFGAIVASAPAALKRLDR